MAAVFFSSGCGAPGISAGGATAGTGEGELVSGSQEGMSGVEDFGPPNEFEVPIV